LFWRVLLLFTLVPLAEVAVMIEVGRRIGTGSTVALILLTGVLGAYLARAEGFGVLRRISEDLENHRVPARGLVDGALVLVGGLLLLTPGFITDALGLLMLLEPSRAWIRGYAGRWLLSRVAGPTVWIVRPRKRE